MAKWDLKMDINDWQELTEEQKQGILDAIEESDSGKGTTHEKVIENMRKKFKHV